MNVLCIMPMPKKEAGVITPTIVTLVTSCFAVHFHLAFLLLAVVAFADMIVRSLEIFRMKAFFREHGFKWTVRRYCKSHCQRQNLRLFFKNNKKLQKELRTMGYRWWHILPDGSPKVLLKIDFWLPSILVKKIKRPDPA